MLHRECNCYESKFNGIDHTNKEKRGISDFLNKFHIIIESIKCDNFNWNMSPIIIDRHGKLVNGAHRISACIFFKKHYKYKISKISGVR